jgi:glutaredoxin
MAKSFLEDNGIPYQDFDVAADRAAREEMVKKSGATSVPVIDIDGDIMVGYDQAGLKEKLGV